MKGDKILQETYDYFKQYIDHPKQDQVEDVFKDAIKRKLKQQKLYQSYITDINFELSGVYKAYNEWRVKKGLKPL